FARFTAVFFPGLSPDVFLGRTVNLGSGPIQVGLSPQRILAILSVIVLTWINVRGVKTAAVIQTSLTVIKTTALAALILLGVTIGRNAAAIDANFGPAFWPAGGLAAGLWPVIGAATVGSLFSMDAWNNVGFAGPRPKDAKRELLNYVIFAALLFYMLTAVGLFFLRARRPDAERPVRAVGYPWLPALYVLGTGVLCVNLLFQQTRYAGLGLIIVALGVPVYFAWRRRVARHQQKPGLVVRLVLDPFHEHLQTVAARREHSRHRAERRVLAPGDLRRRARGIVERDDLDP